MFVLIVTASAPALKPLFSPAFGTKAYTGGGSYHLQARSKSDRSRDGERYANMGGSGDNTSVEGILPKGGNANPNILKTAEYTVHYNNAERTV